MEQEFSKVSEFRKSDKSLKHALESVQIFGLSHMSCWHCGSMLVSYTRGCGFEPFYFNANIVVKFSENI